MSAPTGARGAAGAQAPAAPARGTRRSPSSPSSSAPGSFPRTRGCRWRSCAARARACGTTRTSSTSTSSPASRSRMPATATRSIVSAVREQVAQLMHVSNLFYTEPAMRLAERLARTSLGGKVFLCNSGAEANEAAIKLARKARPAGEVVVLHGAFHGRTYGALSATPQESKQAPFAPLVPGFRAVPATPAALMRGRRRAHGGGAARADPGRDRRARALERAAARGAGGLRRGWSGADLRRGAVRDGAHRNALGLRADRCRARRVTHREGARRRPADRARSSQESAWPTSSRRAITEARSAAARWSRRPRSRRWRLSTTPRCSSACASWASGCGWAGEPRPRHRGPRARSAARVRRRRVRSGGGASGARARAARRQRDRPAHRAPDATADHRRGATATKRCCGSARRSTVSRRRQRQGRVSR